MIDFGKYEAWFVTGSQHLYGEDTFAQVAQHSAQIVRGLSNSRQIPVRIVPKPTMTTPDA